MLDLWLISDLDVWLVFDVLLQCVAIVVAWRSIQRGPDWKQRILSSLKILAIYFAVSFVFFAYAFYVVGYTIWGAVFYSTLVTSIRLPILALITILILLGTAIFDNNAQ